MIIYALQDKRSKLLYPAKACCAYPSYRDAVMARDNINFGVAKTLEIITFVSTEQAVSLLPVSDE